MDLIDSLPDRPLVRKEIEKLEVSAQFDGVFPVYDDRASGRDEALGIVFIVDGSAHAVAYDIGDGVWVKLESQQDVASPDSDELQGIMFSEVDAIQDLQDRITGYIT